MAVQEIHARSILRRHKKVDSWFVARYGMNLYRGCMHNCAYCDGRAEGYYVEGDFGKDVAVKVNAIEVLEKELDPERRRKPLKPGFIMLGGGVGDSYQPLEKRYRLTRRVLTLLCEYHWPVHILTKSTTVERDLDLIKEINKKTRAIVSFSFSTVDDKISMMFESGVPSPSERLKTIDRLRKENIACGIYLLPVIPFITDTHESIEKVIRKAQGTGVDFMVFGGMTLKNGRQKAYFTSVLEKYFPSLVDDYGKLYTGDKWGSADRDYYKRIASLFGDIAEKYRMPQRMPRGLFEDMVDVNDHVVVLLEHIDYYLKIKGVQSPYGRTAYSLSKVSQPLSTVRNELTKYAGVSCATASLIHEILDTGTAELYEKLTSFAG